VAAQAQTDDAVAKGQQVFADNCAICHKIGEQLVGPDLAGVTERRSPEWVKNFIKNSAKMIAAGDKEAIEVFEKFNKVPMTNFEGTIKDPDLDNLVAYLGQAKVEAPAPPPVTPTETPVQAAEVAPVAEPSWWSRLSDNDKILIGFIGALVVVLGGAFVALSVQMIGFLRGQRPEWESETIATPVMGRGLFADLRALFSGDANNQIMKGHAYDSDIQEMDNGMPSWLAYFFYLTILFGGVYLLNYHVFKFSALPADEYKAEMALATLRYGATSDRVSVALVPTTDAAALEAGKASYLANCAVCHGKAGEGGVGPNLADAYWLHGGKFEQVFTSIREGIAAKGMQPWKGKITDPDLVSLTSYLQKLQGTNPPNAKAPQGEKAE
jgi:cytochrome c oxidase cbb3-type subunit 3